MNAIRRLGSLLLVSVVLSGCAKTSQKNETTTAPKVTAAKADPEPAKTKEVAPDPEAKFEAALAKLSDADRVLAKAQKFCPIGKGRLGAMGKPERIELDGQPVFLCCSGCIDDARADPKKTLEKVAELKKNAK